MIEVLGLQFIGIQQADALHRIQGLAVLLSEATQYLQAFAGLELQGVELVVGVDVLLERVDGVVEAVFDEAACRKP